MKLSIITINYNDKIGLEKTIRSVISQTYKDFEYIIIDGGSSDGSLDIIKKYSNYINYWVSEPDKGIYNAMNKGIISAKGEYCNFMNSGDIFYDKNVLKDIFHCKAYNATVITGNTILSGKKNILEKAPDKITAAFLINGTLNHQSSFIKTAILKNDLYNENIKLASDWEFFFKHLILENNEYKHVNRIVSLFELGGISTKYYELYTKEKKEILKKHIPLKILEDYKYCSQLIIKYRLCNTIGRKLITLSSILTSFFFKKNYE